MMMTSTSVASDGVTVIDAPHFRAACYLPHYIRHRPVDWGEGLPVVDELQSDVEVGLLEHRDDLLQIVALFAADAHLVALDLGFDGLGAVVADQLGDLLGVLAGDALFQGAGDLVGLTGGLRLAGVERLEADVAPDQLFLEHVDGSLDALLGGAAQLDGLLALPGDLGVGAAEVEPGGEFLSGLVEGVVDLLPVELAHAVER